MDILLKFLINKMRTIDGVKGSADKILELLQKERELEFQKKSGKKFVSDSIRYTIKYGNEHKIFRKVYLKYKLMRVRSKISFMAFQKRMTILELFVSTI